MSQQNINLAKSFYQAAPRGDMATARQVLDANIEWVEPDLPTLFSGTHRGPDAVFREVIQRTVPLFDNFSVDMTQYFEVGDHVIAVGTFHGRGKPTGKELNAPTAHVWTFRNGKAIRFEAFHDAAKWAAALGAEYQESRRLAA